jgi:hypothetical protein
MAVRHEVDQPQRQHGGEHSDLRPTSDPEAFGTGPVWRIGKICGERHDHCHIAR